MNTPTRRAELLTRLLNAQIRERQLTAALAEKKVRYQALLTEWQVETGKLKPSYLTS